MQDVLLTLVRLLSPDSRVNSLKEIEEVVGFECAARLGQVLNSPRFSGRHNGISIVRCKAWLDQYLSNHEFSASSTGRARDYFRRYSTLVPGGLTPGVLHGKTVLDFGCGVANPLGFSVILFLNGAESVVALDPGEIDREMAVASMKTLLVEVMENPERFDLGGCGVEYIRLRSRRLNWERLLRLEGDECIRFVRGGVRDLDCAFDLILSTSVLEHVKDLAGDLEVLFRLCSDGALMVHRVDFTDHRHFMSDYHKFGFMLDGEHKGLNGLRYSDVISRFLRAGFEVVTEDVRREELDDRFLAAIVEKFRSYSNEDLAISYAGICVRKPERSAHG